jgi:hypothetical protein
MHGERRGEMSKRGLATIIGLAAAALLLVAQPAAAATEVGNQCIGNESETEVTILSTANGPGNPLPATIPSAGVITRWTFNVVPIPSGILTQTLKIFRPTGAPNQFQAIGESSPAAIVSGLNTFSTRISVHAGDYLGTSGTAEGNVVTVFCKTTNAGDKIGVFSGVPPVGSTVTTAGEEGSFQNPITLSVEPDADNDGFGDETQDKCPQSAAFQSECPVVAVDAGSAIKKKGSVTVLVTTTTSAPVVVKGTVNLGKGKKAKLSGGKKTVTPGKIARFTLKFSKKMKARLKELTTKQSLQLKIVATATDLIGRKTTDKLKVKLKGQAKTD